MKTKKNKIEPEFEFRPDRMSRVPKHRRHVATLGETDLKNCKVRVTMYLDADVVENFKRRAARSNAAPYQTLINSALRQFLSGGERMEDYSGLLHDDRFLEAVAKRVRAKMK